MVAKGNWTVIVYLLFIQWSWGPVACPGFILAGAEKNIRWGKITAEGREIVFCPPLKKNLQNLLKYQAEKSNIKYLGPRSFGI